MDKHKLWLIASISMGIIFVASLLLYFNVSSSGNIFGQAVGNSCITNKDCYPNQACVSGVCQESRPIKELTDCPSDSGIELESFTEYRVITNLMSKGQTCFNIETPSVTIKCNPGTVIDGSAVTGDYGALVNSHGVSIEGCTFTNYDFAIQVISSTGSGVPVPDLRILDNTIKSNIFGIVLDSPVRLNLLNNKINSNKRGLVMNNAQSIVISDNQICFNSESDVTCASSSRLSGVNNALGTLNVNNCQETQSGVTSPWPSQYTPCSEVKGLISDLQNDPTRNLEPTGSVGGSLFDNVGTKETPLQTAPGTSTRTQITQDIATLPMELYFPFTNAASGSTITNQGSLSTANAKVIGSASIVPNDGVLNANSLQQGAYVTPASSFLSVPYAFPQQLTASRTISFWFKPTSSLASQGILQWGSGKLPPTRTTAFLSLYYADGAVELHINGDRAMAQSGVRPNQWNHIAIQIDPILPGNIVQGFTHTLTVNGFAAPVYSIPYATSGTANKQGTNYLNLRTANAQTLFFGAEGSSRLNGNLDEIRVFNTYLYPGTISNLAVHTPTQIPPAEICNNNADDDNDGFVDCDDSDCSSLSRCAPTIETQCADNLDNDLDGLYDCNDNDCAPDISCSYVQYLPFGDTNGDGDITPFDLDAFSAIVIGAAEDVICGSDQLPACSHSTGFICRNGQAGQTVFMCLDPNLPNNLYNDFDGNGVLNGRDAAAQRIVFDLRNNPQNNCGQNNQQACQIYSNFYVCNNGRMAQTTFRC